MRGVLFQTHQRCLPLGVPKLPQRSEYLFDIRRELAIVRVYEREERQFVPRMYKHMLSEKPSRAQGGGRMQYRYTMHAALKCEVVPSPGPMKEADLGRSSHSAVHLILFE